MGYAQSLRFLRGHTSFCTTLILKGNRLISGSYDETIRVWDISTGKQTQVLQAKAIACLDYVPEEEVLVAGFHDVGRVQVWSTVTWNVVQTLQGHLYGIRNVAMTSKYVVSAGADKALVCWDWRAGQKIVRFGQQTNLNIGVQVIDDDRVVGITVDGIVRTFSIRRKEMISQFKLNELAAGDPLMSVKLAHVGVGANNMLQWFAAKGKQMTCATKNLIMHLQWEDIPNYPDDKSNGLTSSPNELSSSPTASKARLSNSLNSASLGRKSLASSATAVSRPSLSLSTKSHSRPSLPSSPLNLSQSDLRKAAALATRPPKILALIDTPDMAVGTVDPLKRRVATATRFSSRVGADRRVFLSTYHERVKRRAAASPTSVMETESEPETPASEYAPDPNVEVSAIIHPITGAWTDFADGPPSLEVPGALAKIASLPPDFKGLATPEFNPMSMALSHEQLVIGTAKGDIVVLSFVGWMYGMKEGEGELFMSSGEESDDVGFSEAEEVVESDGPIEGEY